MSYDYQVQKQSLLTDGGQRIFLLVRNHVIRLILIAGAVRMQEAIGAAVGVSDSGVVDDTWLRMACLDRMVELGEIEEVTVRGDTPGQYRLFREGPNFPNFRTIHQ
jgi:hypothetical protein